MIVHYFLGRIEFTARNALTIAAVRNAVVFLILGSLAGGVFWVKAASSFASSNWAVAQRTLFSTNVMLAALLICTGPSVVLHEVLTRLAVAETPNVVSAGMAFLGAKDNFCSKRYACERRYLPKFALDFGDLVEEDGRITFDASAKRRLENAYEELRRSNAESKRADRTEINCQLAAVPDMVRAKCIAEFALTECVSDRTASEYADERSKLGRLADAIGLPPKGAPVDAVIFSAPLGESRDFIQGYGCIRAITQSLERLSSIQQAQKVVVGEKSKFDDLKAIVNIGILVVLPVLLCCGVVIRVSELSFRQLWGRRPMALLFLDRKRGQALGALWRYSRWLPTIWALRPSSRAVLMLLCVGISWLSFAAINAPEIRGMITNESTGFLKLPAPFGIHALWPVIFGAGALVLLCPTHRINVTNFKTCTSFWLGDTLYIFALLCLISVLGPAGWDADFVGQGQRRFVLALVCTAIFAASADLMLNSWSAPALVTRVFIGVALGAFILSIPGLDVIFLCIYALLSSYCIYNLQVDADEDIDNAGLVGEVMFVSFVAFFVQVVISTSFLSIVGLCLLLLFGLPLSAVVVRSSWFPSR
ncbi:MULTISPECIES: hypothetical protein [unclassified Bradyrhizobium]|uniref:hypothetical protein n=1 Tax=unclassified Bradyrhizobium TaxID=2631580 RepID=UPI002915ED43|nr:MULTISPECIES: hypothetical protein [unclassified Bradyrhizobium]